MKYLSIIASIFLLISCTDNHIECGDLLVKYAEKPPKLEYLGCKKGNGQTILKANYKVSGKDAKDVEAFFVESYAMGKLQFVCCGWESKNGKSGSVDNKELKAIDQDYHLLVSMFANAEKLSEDGKKTEIETDRTKIDFTVEVELMKI